MATIQGVYVALFGRPADPSGLAYFNSVTKNGTDLSGIGDLASTDEYKARFKDFSNTQIVTTIYQQLFNRDPEAAGLNFFVDALNKGTLNVKNIAIAILDGAQGNDKTIVTNKVAAADLFTKSLDTPTEIGNYTGDKAIASARTWLSTVTTTVPTQTAVDKAVTDLGTSINVGNSISVAVTADVAVGTSTTANTSSKDDTITVAQVVPLATPADNNVTTVGKIDGGFGNDTVKLSTKGTDGNATGPVDGNAATLNITPEYTSVEKIVVTAVGGNAATGANGGNGNITVALTKATSVTEIVNDSSAIGTGTGGTNGTADVSFTDVSLSTKVTLKGTITGGTSVAFKDATGSADSISVALESGTTANAGTTLNSVETINLSSTGTSSLTALAADTLKTVNITGDGTLTFGTTSTTLETVSASSFTGALTATTLGANDALKSYVGGSGIDTVTIDTLHTNDVTIATGAGADTITVTGNWKIAAGAIDTNYASNKAITLTGGDGSDTFVFGTAAATTGANGDHLTAGAVGNITTAAVVDNASLLKNLITITDFAKGSDSIKVADGAAGASTRLTLTDGDLGTISGQSSLLLAATKAAQLAVGAGVAVFNYGSDAYILVDNGVADTFDAGDTLIKVTGVTAADFTTSNFAII